MPYGSTPPNQRFRAIGFLLAGGPVAGGVFGLTIRPEELTRHEPSRLAVQQTLGGAWADAFGRGVSTIRISGTTGWHGGYPGSSPLSGEDAFHQLREGAFVGWHAAREAVLAGGGDPSVVELTFVDDLDGIAVLAAPKSFSLRRSKSSPLLMRYSIELLVLDDFGRGGAGGVPANTATALTGATAGAAAAAFGAAAAGLGAAAGVFL